MTDVSADLLPKEIERKYLLDGAPDRSRLGVGSELMQGYVPGVRIFERLRRVQRKDGSFEHVRTLKLGRGVSRVEVEEAMDREFFARMWPLTEGRRVHKRRYGVQDGDFVWEVDEFLDRDLWLMEVELTDEAQRPEPPAWLGRHIVREVTLEPDYLNLKLAR